ncbi:MAG: GGDEF domain-containing protein [Spirochaetales bacterium]|nr:GGDEF domain-containing protein [Spirochaetales bacterium]
MTPIPAETYYKGFQKIAVHMITRGLSFFIALGFIINTFWFLWDPFWKIFPQQVLLVLLYVVSLFINRIFRRRSWERPALWTYVVIGYLTGMYFIVTAGDNFLFVGMFIITLFALVSIFSLNRKYSGVFTVLSLVAGTAALFIRNWFPPENTRFVPRDLIQIYMFMLLMEGLLLFLGYSVESIVKRYMTRLYRKSRAVENILHREAEVKRKYQSMFNLIPDLLFLTDREGYILDGNRAILEYSGLNENELKKSHISDFLPDFTGEMIGETITLLGGGAPARGVEMRVSEEGKKDRFFEMSLSPVQEEGEPDRLLILARDISKRKRMEALVKARSDELYRQSVTDPLTGLNNRKKLDDFLSSELDRASRYHTRVSLILADVDHFKRVNDTFGHGIGDVVLKGVADVLSGNIRKTDLAGRWGGEEFLIICPGTNGEEAHVLAEKIRPLIKEIPVKDDHRVSISMGVTEFREGDDIISLMARADKALYEAKNTGRDRTVSL